MGNNKNFHDSDPWEDVLESPQRYSAPRQTPQQQKQKQNDDWDFYMSDSPAGNRRGSYSGRSHRRSGGGIAALILLILAVAVVAVLALVLLPSPFDTDRDDPVVLATEPDLPPAGTIIPIIRDPDPTLPPATTPPPESKLPQETQPPYQDPATYRFYGQQLTDEERLIYDRIRQCVANAEPEITGIRVNSLDDIDWIEDAVFYDYAEYFWFTGTSHLEYIQRDGYVEVTRLAPKYFWDRQTCMDYAAYVEQAINGIIEPVRMASEYEKVRYVYEYLVDNTAYDYAYTGKTIFELLQEGRAVCAAYARGAQYMLTKLDMEIIYLRGEGGPPNDRQGHAWNIVNVGGQYYQMDVTWGDPYHADGTQTKNFKYLLITDAEAALEHFPELNIFPACTAIRYNYYVQEDRYLNFYDTDILLGWMREAHQKTRSLAFKCATEDVYRQILSNLVEGKGIYDLFHQFDQGINGYSYSKDDGMFILEFTW